jgi:hypothetical protein
VCDLLMVHRSTKDADIVQRAGTMMSHLFEEAAIVIEALATAVLVHSCCKWHTTPERHCCTRLRPKKIRLIELQHFRSLRISLPPPPPSPPSCLPPPSHKKTRLVARFQSPPHTMPPLLRVTWNQC